MAGESSLADFRRLFYGGETDEELQFLKDANARGVVAADIIDKVEDTGLRTLSLADVGSPANITDVSIKVRRIGKTVFLRFSGTLGAGWANDGAPNNVITLPAGIRPQLGLTIERMFGVRNGSTGAVTSFSVAENGVVRWIDNAAAGNILSGVTVTYVTNDSFPDPLPGVAG